MANPIQLRFIGWRKRIAAYAFAVVISGLTLEARLALSPWLGEHPLMILFVLPIIFSAYVGGVGPGLVSTALSAGGLYYFLLAKSHNFLFYEGSVSLVQWVLLIVNGILVSMLTEALHRSRRRIELAGHLQAVTLASIGDAVITTDPGGRVTFLNGEAERLTGWTNGGAQGRSLGEVFRVVNEATRQPIEDPVLKVLRTGTVTGLANHTVLVGRDGRETVIDDSGAPIKEGDGRIAGVVLVFRDCTASNKTAQALRESQALYLSLVEQAPAGIFRKDAIGRYVLVNPFFCQLRGVLPEQFLGKLPDELPAAEAPFRAENEEHHERIMRTGEVVAVTQEYHRPDGKTLYFQVVKTPVFDANGKIVGSQGILFDVTERRKAEKTVRDQERLLRQVIDLVPHFIFAKNRQSRHIFVNRACAEGNGLAPEEMVGRCDLEIIADKAQAETFMRNDREVIDSGQRKFIPEERFTRPDGTVRILETTKFPFVMVDTNESAVLGVAVDITERKRLEEELRAAGERMKFYMNRMPLGFIAWDRQFCVAEWNAAAETIFGWTAGEAVGRPALDLISSPPPQGQIRQIWEQTLSSNGETSHCLDEHITRDGRHITCEWRNAPWRDAAGEICGCLCIVSDITRQQALEDQLRQSQKMEAIGQLAGGVAHDFNNILAVIQMQIELSKMGGLSPAQGACLDEIQTAANRGANLTRQLLLFSRRRRLDPRKLDLSESITAMTKMLLRILGEDIQIRFKYGPQPLFVLADAVMMDQILMNLTLNSRDAMPEGGQLVIETAGVELDEAAAAQVAEARPGSFVRLSVTDTGCGIAPEILPRIFEPFFTTKDVGKGTGLGLATVFSIVQQHRGWIQVASQPGRGTTFDIYFPRLPKGAAEPAEPVSPTAAAGGDETILLVEDDDAVRASVRRCLSQLGYRLIEAASGAGALGAWQKHRGEIRLLLTDLVMPGGISGKELGDRLRKEDSKLKVVYISGYSADTFAKEFAVTSGVMFLAKPFPAQELAKAVRDMLDEI